MGDKQTNGIILGEFHKKLMIQPTDSKAPNRNHFVVGGPGSYKTQSYVMTNVLNERECSIVCTDPKGEVYEKTSEIKRKQGYDVRVVNFNNMVNSDRYNAFDYVHKDLQASTVANTIVAAKNDSKKKDIWYNSQLSLLKALILYSVNEMKPTDQNMTGVLDFLQAFDPEKDNNGVSELDQQFLQLDERHPARRAYELGFMKSQEETRASIVISLLTTIGDFVDDEVASFTAFSDFFVGDVGKRKMVVYVIIPLMDSTWEGLINLFFNQMFTELYRLGSENNAKLPQPVFFILDEFANLGRFDDYERFLATCRGYGIGVGTIVQNITQLQDMYGKEKAESIIGNCAVKVCLGNVNETSAKYFMEQMGKATVKVETGSTSKSKGKSESNSASESFNYTGRQLKNLDEILTMSEKECIVIMTGKNPVLAQKAFQFNVFPGFIPQSDEDNPFLVRQNDYDNEPTQGVLKAFDEKMQTFDDGQRQKEDDYDNQENAADDFFGKRANG